MFFAVLCNDLALWMFRTLKNDVRARAIWVITFGLVELALSGWIDGIFGSIIGFLTIRTTIGVHSEFFFFFRSRPFLSVIFASYGWFSLMTAFPFAAACGYFQHVVPPLRFIVHSRGARSVLCAESLYDEPMRGIERLY